MTRGAHPTPLSLVWGSLPPLLVTATQQSGEPLTQKTGLATLIETKRTAALKRQKVNFSCGKEKLIRGPRIQSGRSPEPVQGRVIRSQFAQNKEGSQNMRFLVLKLDSPRQTLTGWPASSRIPETGPVATLAQETLLRPHPAAVSRARLPSLLAIWLRPG